MFSKSKVIVSQAACVCHVGKRRKNNEDNFYFDGVYLDAESMGTTHTLSTNADLKSHLLGTTGKMFAVFDGVGGADYGEEASFTAARETKRYLDDASHLTKMNVADGLRQWCVELSKSVYEKSQEFGGTPIGSTLAAVYVDLEKAWVCNLGDSRCYLFRDGMLKQLTVDHSAMEDMRINGVMRKRKCITQWLGMDPSEVAIVPFIKECDLKRGDRFLICSDGVSDMVSEPDVAEIMTKEKKATDCAEKLLQAALEAGGRDNITALILDIR